MGRGKFRTERLVARSWQIGDVSLATELWGDPAVTALIDARGRLSEEQVEEKLRAEIEREQLKGVQYWPLFDSAMTISSVAPGCGPGSIRPMKPILRSGSIS